MVDLWPSIPCALCTISAQCTLHRIRPFQIGRTCTHAQTFTRIARRGLFTATRSSSHDHTFIFNLSTDHQIPVAGRWLAVPLARSSSAPQPLLITPRVQELRPLCPRPSDGLHLPYKTLGALTGESLVRPPPRLPPSSRIE